MSNTQQDCPLSNAPGRFVWYELMTTDPQAAQAFYGAVVGWGTQDGAPGTNYTLFTAAGRPASGVMALPDRARAMGVPPHWLGYVLVDDVDAAAEQMLRLGGTVHVPPKDIPEVARLAVVADPQGAALGLMKWSKPGRDQPAGPKTPGHIGWHELLAADLESAFGAYGAMFGWQKADAVDMGPMGIYQLFGAGEAAFGGMFTKPPSVPVPAWQYYINVGDIDAAAGRVSASGGQVISGPMEVPGGDWILQGIDPQGAMFALLGMRAGT